MPQISKQHPTRAPSSNSGSILDRAVPVGKLPTTPLKVLMYGANRAGKTTFACCAAKPLLLVSFEPAVSGGIDSVRKIPGVSVLRHGIDFKGMEQTLKLVQEIASAPGRYKSVVVDSVTSLQDCVLSELLDLSAVPDQMSWGTVTSDQYRGRSEKTRECLRPFVDLKVDTIFLGKERDHNPPKEEKVSASGKKQPDMRPRFLRGVQQESYIATDLGGATVGWIQDVCDCICRLFVEKEEIEEIFESAGIKQRMLKDTGRFARYLRLAYHNNYAAGIRSPNPGSYPDVLGPFQVGDNQKVFDQLMKILRG